MEVWNGIKPPVTFILGKGPSLYVVETSWTPGPVRTLSWVLQSPQIRSLLTVLVFGLSLFGT